MASSINHSIVTSSVTWGVQGFQPRLKLRHNKSTLCITIARPSRDFFAGAATAFTKTFFKVEFTDELAGALDLRGHVEGHRNTLRTVFPVSHREDRDPHRVSARHRGRSQLMVFASEHISGNTECMKSIVLLTRPPFICHQICCKAREPMAPRIMLITHRGDACIRVNFGGCD